MLLKVMEKSTQIRNQLRVKNIYIWGMMVVEELELEKWLFQNNHVELLDSLNYYTYSYIKSKT